MGVLASCTGSIGDGAADPESRPPNDDPDIDPDITLADQRVRRLTEREYHATVAALFRASLGEVPFPTASAPNGYDNSAAGLRVEGVLTQSLWNTTSEMADAGADVLLAEGCTPASETDEVCAAELLGELTARAYRRELDDTDREQLLTLFRAGAQGGTFREGLRVALRFVLQSPDLLYRRELGEAGDDGVAVLSGEETASLLAYLLTGEPPDERLRELATRGELSDGEVRASEVRRLLEGASAEAVIARFGQQWLEAEHLDLLARDPETYPEWATLREAFEEEAGHFFADAVLQEDAGLPALFRRSHTRGGDDLAAFYGASRDGDVLRFPDDERRGVLMLGGVLSHLAQAVQPSPVQRGHFVRTRLLCQTLPDPPPDLVVAPPPPDPTRTNRESWEETTNGPTCAVCHTLMNPIGFAFESFDAIGRYRTVDNGQAVDTTGTLGGTDVDAPFADAVELSELLAESEIARRCFAAHWSEFALGTSPSPARRRTAELAATTYMEGGSIAALIEDFVAADAFVRRRVVSEGESL